MITPEDVSAPWDILFRFGLSLLFDDPVNGRRSVTGIVQCVVGDGSIVDITYIRVFKPTSRGGLNQALTTCRALQQRWNSENPIRPIILTPVIITGPTPSPNNPPQPGETPSFEPLPDPFIPYPTRALTASEMEMVSGIYVAGAQLWLGGPIVNALKYLDGRTFLAGGVARIASALKALRGAGPIGSVAAGAGGTALRKVGDLLQTIDDVLANPKLLKGLTPSDVLLRLGGKTPAGWRVEGLGRGSHRGQGWVLREYTSAGQTTGRMIRWHPQGDRHGPNPYWIVNTASAKTRVTP